MSDEQKKNRIDIGGSSGNSNNQNNLPPVDDIDSSAPKKGLAGKIIYIFLLAVILGLLVFLFKIYNQNQILQSNEKEFKNELSKIKHEKEKTLYGDLSIEIEPDDTEIFLNGELQKKGKGIKINNATIKNKLVFEFKKPGYYPYKLEVGECNWQLKAGSKDAYFYENRDVHLAVDANEMMMIENAEKEKKQMEEEETKKKKKKNK